MTALETIWLLAARRWDLRSMGEGFRGENAEFHAVKLLTIVAVILVVCVGLVVFERLARRSDRAPTLDSPAELFRELCRLHRVDRAGRRLLKRLAVHWGLASPALLFVEPEYFQPAKLPEEWQPESRKIDRLRRKLFGGF